MFVRILRIIAWPAVRISVLMFAAIFLSSGLVFAQNVSYQNLPQPGTLLKISPEASYPVFTGIRFNPDDPLNLTFLADRAGKDSINKEEASKLIYYFLAGLTVPEDELWVNLSPYEKDRIASDNLAVTDLGSDMLAQDYILKQLTASLTYPESLDGKAYWSDVYNQVFKQLGTTNTSVNSFNKVWITPGAITIYEKDNAAFIASADLKVLTDFDYKALMQNLNETIDPTIEITAKALREKIIPVITKEVNRGENFAPLRQIYRSLILAAWFKKKFKESFYKAYIGKAKVKGIDLAEKNSREKIFNLYVEAFKKGSYDYIRHEYDKRINKRLRRHYYSGGVSMSRIFPVDTPGGASGNHFGPGAHAPTVLRSLEGVLAGALGEGGTAEVDGRVASDIGEAPTGTGRKPEVGAIPQAEDALAVETKSDASVAKTFLDPAVMADGEPVPDAVRADWQRYNQRYGSLVSGESASANPEACARIARVEMAAAQAALDEANAQGEAKGKPQEYRLTPYMEYWLEHADVEELGQLLSDTPFVNDNFVVIAPDSGAAAIDQLRARRFGAYFWLRVLKRLEDRSRSAEEKYAMLLPGAEKKEASREAGAIEALLDSKLPVAADSRGRMQDVHDLPLGHLPQDITNRDNYRIFFGGTNLILVNKKGRTYRIPLPQAGKGHPYWFINEFVLTGDEHARELAKDGIPHLIVPVGEKPIVLRNGALLTVHDTIEEGDSLDHLDLSDFSPDQRLRFFINALTDIAETLVAMHRKGKVHRDVKPQNMLANKRGQVVLSDLDLVAEEGIPFKLDDFRGTPSYVPPEVDPNPERERYAGEIATKIEFKWDDFGFGETLSKLELLVKGLYNSPRGYSAGQNIWENVPPEAREILEQAREIFEAVKAGLRQANRAQRTSIVAELPRLEQVRNMVNAVIPERVVPVVLREKGTPPPIPDAVRKEFAPTVVTREKGTPPPIPVSEKQQKAPLAASRASATPPPIPDEILVEHAPTVVVEDKATPPPVPDAAKREFAPTVVTREKGTPPPIPASAKQKGNPAASDKDSENGGIDFNYRNFDIKTGNSGKAVSRSFTGVEYSGIVLKNVTTKTISPSTSLSAWAAYK